jgi:hypothetical protein
MDNKKPTGAGTPEGRQSNPDACNSTPPDPLGGWLDLGKPSRTKRQAKRQWVRGRK